jgi:hypothetical protein
MNHQDWGGQVDSALDCAGKGIVERFGDKVKILDPGSFNPTVTNKMMPAKRPFKAKMDGVEVSVDVLDWSGSLMSGYRTQFEIFRNSEKVASLPLEHRENATKNAGQQLTEAIARAFG